MDTAPSLLAVLATIPDPRKPSGLRHPLPAVLNLLVVATLVGMRSLEAVAQFARDHGAPLAHALGFRSARTPCKATLSNILRQLDCAAVEHALARWVRARCPDLGNQLCLDGKSARAPATEAFPSSTSWPLTRLMWPPSSPTSPSPTRPTSTRPRRNCWECSRAPARSSPATPCSATATCAGRSPPGAARTCSRSRTTNPRCTSTSPACSPSRRPFPYQQARWASERDAVTTTNKGHGRVDTRTLTATPALNKYLSAWPGVAQVFRLHRTRRFADGRVEQETAYGITSRRPGDAGASRLLDLNRAHWSIENNLHQVRGVAFGEDASRVRSGNAPQVLAALRNALIHLLTSANVPNLTAALRRFAVRPLDALRLLNVTPPPEN